MRKSTVGHVAGLLIAILLSWRAVAHFLVDNLFDATSMGVAATTILALLYQARTTNKRQSSSRQEFTQEQFLMMKDLIAKERESIERGRQEIITEGAKRGETISTEQVLKRVEDLKSTYDGPNREQFVQDIDRITREFREIHGPQIPIDEAYGLLKELEQKGPERDQA